MDHDKELEKMTAVMQAMEVIGWLEDDSIVALMTENEQMALHKVSMSEAVKSFAASARHLEAGNEEVAKEHFTVAVAAIRMMCAYAAFYAVTEMNSVTLSTQEDITQ